MKVNHYLLLAALSLLAMSNSCKKEEEITPCAATEIETAQITSLKPTIPEPVPYVGQTNEYLINSAAEYQEVFGGILPPVDFTNYTLLAGKTRLPSRGHVLAQQVTQTCLGYTYTVQLEAGPQPVATNVVYYVLVPKIAPGTKVAFDIKLPPLAPKS